MGDVPGALARPRGVAVDSEGHVYVSDAAFDNIQIFDGLGNLLLYFGALGGGPGQFNLPAGLYVDAEDRLYVADSFNRRVQIFQYLAEDRVK
jgi:DNA-binding beta-propeller fold protein YncE